MTDQIPIEINKVVFGKEEFDQIVNTLQDAEADARDRGAPFMAPERILAQQVADGIGVDAPDFLSYRGLRDGTAKIFEADPLLAKMKPGERRLTDEQILLNFAEDPEGNPLTMSTLEAFLREFPKALGALKGTVEGAKAGAKIPGPPPVKLGGGVVGGLLGGITGYMGVQELVVDPIAGEEQPIIPSHRARIEGAKTAANAVAFLPFPFMLRNVDIGTAAYLNQLGAGFAKTPRGTKFVQAAEGFLNRAGDLARKNPLPTLMGEGVFGAGATVGAVAAEKAYPGQALPRIGGEVVFGAGASVLTSPAGLIARNSKGISQALKNLYGDYKTEGIIKGTATSAKRGFAPLANRRKNAAIKKVIEILDAHAAEEARIDGLPEDQIAQAVEAARTKLIQDLEAPLVLLDEASGKPLEMTAGTKTGNKALLAIEAQLDQLSGMLGQEKTVTSQKAQRALQNLIAEMAASGDQDALQTAADLAAGIFEQGLLNRLGAATETVLDAQRRVAGDSPEDMMGLGQKLYDVFTAQLRFARNQETQIWGDIPNIPVSNFIDDVTGETSNMPVFLQRFDKEFSDAEPEYIDAFLREMPGLRPFAQRIRQELGLGPTPGSANPAEKAFETARNKITGTSFGDTLQKNIDEVKDLPIEDQIKRMRDLATQNRGKFSNERRRQAANAYDKYAELLQSQQATPTTPTAPSDPLNMTGLNKMRSLMLDYGRSLTANGQFNKARVAFNMADGMLKDMDNALVVDPKVAERLELARAYTKSLNDVFTRGFGGQIGKSTRAGDQALAPELIANRVLQGGRDLTFLRFLQIQEVGQFGLREGLPDADVTVGTLLDISENIIRNARAAAFDVETGAIDPKKLQDYIQKNEKLLEPFPALRADLEDAQKANALLKTETTEIGKARARELKDQGSFFKIMNPSEDPATGLPRGIESPTVQISRILGERTDRPLNTLNKLLKDIKTATKDDPALQADALSGLKSTLFEWANGGAGATHSGTYSPSAAYRALFLPRKNNKVPVADWMVSNDVVSKVELDRLKEFMQEMVKFEGAQAAGTLDDVVDKAGPILDFYLAITGSAIGTRAQAALTGGQGGTGSIIAAGKGAQLMRDLFKDIPAVLQTDVMSEVMRDPKLLALMLRKPPSDVEKFRVGTMIKNSLARAGFLVPQTVTPSTIRESVEEIQAPENIPLEQSALPQVPVARAQPRQVLPPIAAAPPAPSTQPAPIKPTTTASGPVDRNRFAALFPEDKDLIQGIGSLMG
jgi:hypothetical protein